jgi:2-polyprenyl-6-methoxyphenol hydroxylase-like FAD-dependent oxidoreductase
VAAAFDFDLLVIGGGLGGSALATVMAREGASVAVVERERAFRDRVRGEVIAPWGCAEAKRLGLFALLLDRCGQEVLKLIYHVEGFATPPIDLREAAPHLEPSLAFRHPEMQEVLITEAAAAGATVWRPAKLAALTPGDAPAAEIAVDGAVRTVRARLIVGADGRDSQVAHLAGFERLRDPDELLAAGLLVQGEMDTEGALHYLFGPQPGRAAGVCEVAPGFFRLYLFHHTDATPRRLSGNRDVEAALAYLGDSGVPGEWLVGAELHGPLATFDGAHKWVVHPYRDGIVLVGDAAGASDPTWGSGLGRTLRDVRLLRDALVGDTDWERAADAYAEQHDDFWDRLHDVERLTAAALMSVAPMGPTDAREPSRSSSRCPSSKPGRTARRHAATIRSASNCSVPPDAAPHHRGLAERTPTSLLR